MFRFERHLDRRLENVDEARFSFPVDGGFVARGGAMAAILQCGYSELQKTVTEKIPIPNDIEYENLDAVVETDIER